MLLAAAVPARAGERCLELGLGAGVASLCLLARVPVRVTGLELQPPYAALARRNAALNGAALEVVEGDVRDPPPLGAFDHVLLNPPFFDRSASLRARDAGREAARGGEAPLAAWLALALRALRPGGRVTLVARAAMLPALLASRLGSVEVLPLAAAPGAAPATILLRARRGGRAPFRLLAPLVTHGGGGRWAPWAEGCLRHGLPIPWA